MATIMAADMRFILNLIYMYVDVENVLYTVL